MMQSAELTRGSLWPAIEAQTSSALGAGELSRIDAAQRVIVQNGLEFLVNVVDTSEQHGESGNGNGITAQYGMPIATNLSAKLNAISPESYPDGRIFDVITRGKGLMGAYGANIPVRDRWAIIAYIHTLQAAKVSSK